MFSIAFSVVSTFLFSPLFWIGYAVAVLFPVPFVNSFIVGLWAKFGGQIKALFVSLTTKAVTETETTVVAAVTTAVDTAVTKVITTPPTV